MRGRRAKVDQAVRIAASYTRVSSQEQAEGGHSLAAQAHRLGALAIAHETEIRGAYVDAGFSAGTMNRPDLARLLADVRAGKIRALYVTKLDRLTRRLTDLLEIVKILERHGCALISASETVDTSTPTGRMMLQLLGVFAEFERARIGERTADVLGDRRRRGKAYTGVTPFGYTRDGDELVPNPEKLAALDEAKAMLDGGASLRQVGSFLTRRVGGCWHPQTVKDVLSSRIARERVMKSAY